jgi:hypothetical protein
MPMDIDTIAKKIASLYLSSAALATIVAILTLGEPFIMLGSIAALGLITVLGDSLAEYGVETVLHAVYAERSKQESVQSLLQEIEGLPITGELKFKLKNQLISQNITSNQEIKFDEIKVVEIEE